MRVGAAAVGLGIILLLTAPVCAQTTRTTGAEKFIGTWRLVSITWTNPEVLRERGAHPTGMLVYDNTGHVAVQIIPDRKRKPFTGPVSPVYGSASPTPDEAVDALMGYAAYFGTYSVDQRA